MQTPPDVAAAAEALAAIPLPPRPTDGTANAGSYHTRWRRYLKSQGGHITNIVFTPAAWSALRALTPCYETQNQAVNAAILAFGGSAPPVLDADGQAAVDQLRHDWPLASDAEALSLAARWLAWYVEKYAVKTLHFGE